MRRTGTRCDGLGNGGERGKQPRRAKRAPIRSPKGGDGRETAALAPDEIEHHVVRRPDQTFVAEPVGVMARRSKVGQQFDREFSSSVNLTGA